MIDAKLEAQCKTIFHFWMNDIHSPKEIYEKNNIPLRTIGSIEHKSVHPRLHGIWHASCSP